MWAGMQRLHVGAPHVRSAERNSRRHVNSYPLQSYINAFTSEKASIVRGGWPSGAAREPQFLVWRGARAQVAPDAAHPAPPPPPLRPACPPSPFLTPPRSAEQHVFPLVVGQDLLQRRH